MLTITRYHDFCCGHRIVGHESCCKNLHGHNYRVYFTLKKIEEELDAVGRVLDFAEIKKTLCQWLEENWDHKLLLWEKDPWFNQLLGIDPTIVSFPFNPTAENMAICLVDKIGPQLLAGTNCCLIKVVIEETRKCSCSYEKREL